LERPFADGAEVLILEACELLRRLAAARPATPLPPRPLSRRVRSGANATTPPESRARAESSRIPWAELLLRVFREDVLVCPCGGRRLVLAFITEKKVLKEILEHLGLPTTGPPQRRAGVRRPYVRSSR